MRIRALVELVEHDGWRLVRTRGSHRQYSHPSKPGCVTIPGHLSDEISPATLNSVLKQAQIPKETLKR